MNRWLLSVAVLSATLLGAVAAQPDAAPKISGATKYEPHSLVKLQAENVNEKAGLLWRVYPSEGVQKATTPRGLLQFTAHPGKYTVELLVISGSAETGLVITEAQAIVVIDSCQPPIIPPTPPGPNPPSPQPPPPSPGPGKGKLDPSNAIGRIQFGSAGCSATVVGPRRPDGRWDVLTAAHCNGGVGQTGTMKMPASGKVYGVKTVVHNRTADVCWMVTTDSIDDIEYALLARENPPGKRSVWHQGYGYDKPRNREDGYVITPENSQGQSQFYLSVSSGDSGGGIFDATTNEVLSTVCCTSAMARPGSMYGGCARVINQLRPKATGEERSEFHPNHGISQDNWIPIALPIVHDDWRPTEGQPRVWDSQQDQAAPGVTFGVPLGSGRLNWR